MFAGRGEILRQAPRPYFPYFCIGRRARSQSSGPSADNAALKAEILETNAKAVQEVTAQISAGSPAWRERRALLREDLLAARLTKCVELQVRVLVARGDARITDEHGAVPSCAENARRIRFRDYRFQCTVSGQVRGHLHRFAPRQRAGDLSEHGSHRRLRVQPRPTCHLPDQF